MKEIELKDGDVFYTKHTAIQKSKSDPNKWVITDVRVVNVIEIPENATNGDILKLVFPKDFDGTVAVIKEADWWNAPYERKEV